MLLYSPTSRYARPLAIALIIIGIISIAAPLMSSIVITLLVACAVVVAGIVHLTLAFQHQHAGSRIWHIVAALVLIAGGGLLIALPLDAAASFTLVIAALFVVTGLMRISAWLSIHAKAATVWVLVDGIITTVLGVALIAMWPSSSLWTIGTLAGVSFIFNGFAALQNTSKTRQHAARLRP
ncbi:MAG: DUF308 domain-containing protein [Rhodanobacter sp.]